MNKVEQETYIRLSAQRALLGHIPPSLRMATISIVNDDIIWECIFDKEVTEGDMELLSIAGTEILSDNNPPFDIKEIFKVVPFPEKQPREYDYKVYERYEGQYDL